MKKKVKSVSVKNKQPKKVEYKFYKKKNLGKKRSEMPQIDSDNVEVFVEHFEDKDIKVSEIKIGIGKLKPTQDEINEKKLKSFIKKKFDWKKRIYVISSDHYLLDAHHSYAQGLEDDENYEVVAYKIDLKIKDLLKRANKMKITNKVDVNDKVVKSVDLSDFAKSCKFITDLQRMRMKIGDDEYEKCILINKAGNKQVIWCFDGEYDDTVASPNDGEFMEDLTKAVINALDKKGYEFVDFNEVSPETIIAKACGGDIEELSWYKTKNFDENGSVGIRINNKTYERRVKSFELEKAHQEDANILNIKNETTGEKLFNKILELNYTID